MKFDRRYIIAAAVALILVVIGVWVAFRPSESQPDDPDHSAHIDKATIWTCSMHPQIRQSEPGSCPICGMDLIPVESTVNNDDTSRIVLSERAKTLARFRTTVVKRLSEGTSEVRLLGRVEPNESTLRTVTAWTGGRIDRLRVNTTGTKVRAGQIIATLYSPEVYAAHADLLVAKKQAAALSASPTGKVVSSAALSAARERLRLLGVPDDELARMEKQDSPTRALSIRSPFSGTVMERLVTEGAYVSTGTPLYRIADLGTLWIQLDAYDSDLGRIALDQTVDVQVEGVEGEIQGKVTFIDPTLDPRRRTAKIRVEVPNDGRLRPGMFAQAVVRATTTQNAPLVVPDSAPLFTGRRSIVYVEVPGQDRPTYEPKTVRLGPRLGSFYPVVAGLSEGDVVVSKGAFVLDADLQIRGGASMMSASDDRDRPSVNEFVTMPSDLERLGPIVTEYLRIQEALAKDDFAGATAGAAALAVATKAVSLDGLKAKEAFAPRSELLQTHARALAAAADIERARLAFESLSHDIEALLRTFGNPLDTPIRVVFCPMAMGSKGAIWFQTGDDIANAYFGAAMLTCGEVRAQVDPGTQWVGGAQ